MTWKYLMYRDALDVPGEDRQERSRFLQTHDVEAHEVGKEIAADYKYSGGENSGLARSGFPRWRWT
jgi:hypothetical protein